MMWTTLQPPGWAEPKGYANGVEATGRMVFIAGMIGWNASCEFETDDFIGQCRQALKNIVDTLACSGGRPEHVVRLTWYVKDKKVYLARARELGKVYKEIMGAHYPAMTLVQVVDLLEDRALLEIEATAVLPMPEAIA
jgi:enamine deaminase RidA (YjgF/YER057c/UK114 family)